MSESIVHPPKDAVPNTLHKRGPGLLSTMFFTNTTPDYDKQVNPKYYEILVRLMGRAKLGKFVADKLQDYLPSTENARKKVLDLGAGTGLSSEALYKNNYKVTSADLSERALTYLREKRPYLDAVKLNMNEILPFPDGSFDGITTVASNRYITDTKEFLRETHRILKPGGVFLWPILDAENFTSVKNLGMFKKFNPETLKEQALENGFKDVKLIKSDFKMVMETIKRGIRPEFIPSFVIAIK